MEHDMKSNKTSRVTDVTDQFDINVTRARARACEDIPKAPDTSVTQRPTKLRRLPVA